MNIIAEYKQEHGLTVKEMADVLDVSTATIKNHLTGRSRPKPCLIKKYVEIFGLDAYDVFSISDKAWPRDLMGQRFGRLIVIDYAGSEGNFGGNCIKWRCLCDCDNEATVRSSHLTSGHTQSCGCLGRENLTGGGHNKLDEGMATANVLLYNYKKSAKQRGYIWDLRPSEFLKLTHSNCHYCGAIPSQVQKANGKGNANGDYLYNGIDRVDNSKGYTPENSRPCCRQCNVAKGMLSEKDFLTWIKRVYLEQGGQNEQ